MSDLPNESVSPEYIEPRDRVEREVAAIWADLLQVERVGVQDNFLLLGGESLLAAHAAARIKQHFRVEVTLRSVLIGTVADVAAEIVTSANLEP